MTGELLIEVVLSLCWRHAADGLDQSAAVKPVHPFSTASSAAYLFPRASGSRGGGKTEPEPPGPGPLPEPPPRPIKLEVKLADGKVRQIQSMTATTFGSSDGTPMSAAQFLENLDGVPPEFFKEEEGLRTL